MTGRVVIGVSLKMYFEHADALRWFGDVAALMSSEGEALAEHVEFFICPTYLQILPAIESFAGEAVGIGAQDIAAEDTGPFTGEVGGRELAAVGAQYAEVGHAERRRLFAESDADVAAKTTAALRNGLVPVICVGELERMPLDQAIIVLRSQITTALEKAPPGRVIIAYEPVWSIGTSHPATIAYIDSVAEHIVEILEVAGRSESSVIYGGSAGPGMLDSLGGAVDGLFLGRFAHDVAALRAVLREAWRRGSRPANADARN